MIEVARSLKEGFFMFYETFWALVLGFGLSGVVQVFAAREEISRRLGNHGPRAIVRACLYGMASSSCSYAASAMAKSLYRKGADFVTSMAFMFASTNLVIELGIVLVVLIGWQFMAAEFLGGAIMIVLLALTGGWFLRTNAAARQSPESENTEARHAQCAGPTHSMSNLRSLSHWSDAARCTLADLKMLRREMLIGYTVAGFLAVLVPTQVWNDVFLKGHGIATTLENVAVGPFIALISCVCSIGNVPLAAALWKGGISFGGVLSFLFADLIALPLLLVYRKLFGTKLMLRMLGVFWATMSVAGLVTQGIFRAARVVPTAHRSLIVTERFTLGPTSILAAIFLILFAFLLVLARRRRHSDGSSDFSIDPVCAMHIETENAPASCVYAQQTIFFCSERCRDRFVSDPPRYFVKDDAPIRHASGSPDGRG